jgi:hypothetical protein
MSIIGSNILAGASGQAGGGGAYEVERSVRFNSSDSAYLGATFGTPTDQDVFTLSMWVKRAALGTTQHLFGVSTNHSFGFTSGNALNLTFAGSSALTTTALFRDPSAWYHIMWVQNGTAHTLYVNDASVGTATATSSTFNTAVAHQIGAANTANYFNGYLTDIHFIDGQALTPSSFGETDTNGVWQPIDYAGSFGTNGFHLPFSDNSTAAALGTDTSGNGNTWTVNNLSVAAGAGNDSVVDSPTDYGTDTGAGGEVRGNFCTWNPLINGDTAANGNLDVTNDTARGTQKLLEYDAYWEITSTGGTTTAGVVSDGGTTNTTTVANGKTYGFKLSAAGELEYINITDGGSFTSITTGLTGILFPYASAAASTTGSLNAGQRLFAATAPSGFKALCTTNLPEPTIADGSTAMDVALYTGNGSTQTISGLNFDPDLVWIKGRSGATDHALYDTVRTATNQLESNTATAETTEATGLTAFATGGFSLGALAQVNTSSATYAAWTWDAGSSTVTNTDGSITSQVRANASAGFSVVTYTGTGSSATVGHGLGVTPSLIILKRRDAVSSTLGWIVFSYLNGALTYGRLDSTNSFSGAGESVPTSSVFSILTHVDINAASGTYVAYCFAPVAGYSAFGSYTGNGSADGPFVYTGFKPAYVLLKATAAVAGNWVIYDYSRGSFNLNSKKLGANLGRAENDASFLGDDAFGIDFLSNGFKIRTTGPNHNNSSVAYVYACFAESPFAYSRAR